MGTTADGKQRTQHEAIGVLMRVHDRIMDMGEVEGEGHAPSCHYAERDAVLVIVDQLLADEGGTCPKSSEG